MKNNNSKLPLFMHEPEANKIIRETISCIPKKTKVFLVGGRARNAIYYEHFKEKLAQRDYDLLVMGDAKEFISNLRERKFTYGKIKRKYEIVLRKKKIPKPKRISDYVVLDIHISKEKNIKNSLKEKSNFTFNAFALPLEEAVSKDWYKKMISLPNSLKDLKNKQIKINQLNHPANLFACIRFMSKGFKKPSKKNVKDLLSSLKKIRKDRFKKNVRKVFDYVGGEKKARILAKKLGIKENLFDYETLKKINLK